MCTFWLKVKHDMIKVVQFLRFKLILHLKYQLEVEVEARPEEGTNAAHAPWLIRPHVMHAHIQIRCA